MKFLCLCCYNEVPPGAAYCPTCLISLLTPDEISINEEEVIDDGDNWSS